MKRNCESLNTSPCGDNESTHSLLLLYDCCKVCNNLYCYQVNLDVIPSPDDRKCGTKGTVNCWC